MVVLGMYTRFVSKIAITIHNSVLEYYKPANFNLVYFPSFLYLRRSRFFFTGGVYEAHVSSSNNQNSNNSHAPLLSAFKQASNQPLYILS